uniref:Tudor domain-containing protein n=1 Tax=Culex tarsalis TaxID=7177 RepID=A0A1Q3EWU6_CULTA
MDNRSGTNSVLEGLILRAEDVLGKMLLKLQRSRMPLEEKVRMINALHAFVDQWEGPLADIKLPPELQQQMAQPSTKPKSHGDEIMDVMQMLGLNGDDNGGGGGGGREAGGRPVKNAGGRSVVAVPVPQEEAEPVFEVLEQSLKEYKPNRTGRCVISSVVPGGQRSFCIVDRDHRDCTKLLAAMQHTHGARLAQLPARPGEVFGVFLEGTLYRAVRNRPPLEGSRMRADYIRLLDTGEVLAFEADAGAMLCDLSEYYRKFPAFAIRCVLVNVLDDPFSCDDLNRYLRNNLHATQHYKVVSAEGHILYLRLSQQPITENPFSGDLSADSATSSLSDSSDSDSSREPRRPRLVPPPSPQKKPTTPRWDIFKVDNPDKSNGTPIVRPAGVPPEKPPTPPKKASNLKKPESDDYVVPPVGSHLYLVPKFIRDVDHFWCHVVEGDRVNADLMELEMKLNDTEYSRTFRKFDQPPAFAEPCFAKYTDRKWYRAEVAEYFDEANVKVFYVDYGNCELVRTDEMRRWDDRFSYLPYQAVLCRLADVRAVRPFHKQAVVEMNRVLLNQRVLAKIVNNGTPWEVILYDKDGFNVATGLLLAGLAKKLYEDAAELAEAARLISNQRDRAPTVKGR